MAMKRYLQPIKTQPIKRICKLKSLDETLQNIELSFDKETIEIGRTKDSGIEDTFCSKKQLSICVDFDICEVDIHVLGVNPSGLNGFLMQKGCKCKGKHGDIIEVVYDRYKYEIEFHPAPNASVEEVMVGSEEVTSSGLFEIVMRDMMIFTERNVRSSEKIAAYDLDGTLIKTKSGNVFPKNTSDWEIAYAEVPKKLQDLYESGYKICFFTNQGGINKGSVPMRDFQLKLKAIIHKLGIPVQVFVALSHGIYRKPALGMWNYLNDHKNDDIEIDMGRSFFVGDAAGRPEMKGAYPRKRDHSSADRLFAINIGIPFYTPEEHFLNQKKMAWIEPEFNPRELKVLPLFENSSVRIPSDKCELIILVGLVGSGKSHFARNNLEPLGYSIVNADLLGNVKTCLTACENNLKDDKRCVIDNTNVDVESRKKFIALAKKYNIPCRCFLMNTSESQIKHNIAFRNLTDEEHTKVSSVVFNTMRKKFVKPTHNEGFSELVLVNVVFNFKNDEQEKLYKMYLVEK